MTQQQLTPVYHKKEFLSVSLKELKHFTIGIKSERRRLELQRKELEKVGVVPELVLGCASKNIEKKANITLSWLEALLSIDHYPSVVLESDSVPFSDWCDEQLFPADADAFYLGTSVWGVVPEELYPFGLPDCVLSTPYYGNIHQVFNMLAAHAILFVSEEGRDKFVDACLDALKAQLIQDIFFARLQEQNKVFSVQRPVYFQSGKLRGQEASTNKELIPQNIPKGIAVNWKGKRIEFEKVERNNKLMWREKGKKKRSLSFPVFPPKENIALKKKYIEACEEFNLKKSAELIRQTTF